METPLLVEPGIQEKHCKENQIVYTDKIMYLPAYSCFIVKTLSGVDPTFGTVCMDYTLCIWVGVDGLDKEEIKEVDEKFKLRINE
jgi:hypothetical protein